jgi:hypothetical protein
MGSPKAIGLQDGLVRVDVPLTPGPPEEWIEIFNRHTLMSVAMPESWNRPIAHSDRARLTARPDKLLEYLGHVKLMITAANAIYRGDEVVAVARERKLDKGFVRNQSGPRPNLEACQRMLDEFDPS